MTVGWVGQPLESDKPRIANNTMVMFSTDNGAAEQWFHGIE